MPGIMGGFQVGAASWAFAAGGAPAGGHLGASPPLPPAHRCRSPPGGAELRRGPAGRLRRLARLAYVAEGHFRGSSPISRQSPRLNDRSLALGPAASNISLASPSRGSEKINPAGSHLGSRRFPEPLDDLGCHNSRHVIRPLVLSSTNERLHTARRRRQEQQQRDEPPPVATEPTCRGNSRATFAVSMALPP